MKSLMTILLAALIIFTSPGFTYAAVGDHLSASINQTDRTVSVTGRLASSSNGEVLLTVIDPSGKLAYFNQKKSDAQGNFQFSYVSLNPVVGENQVRVVGSTSNDGEQPLYAVYTYIGGTTPPAGPENPSVQPGVEVTQDPLLMQNSRGDVTFNVPVTYDAIAKVAQTTIDPELFQEALQITNPDAKGVKHLTIKLQSVEGSDEYRMNLPKEALNAENKNLILYLDTPIGTLLVSEDMLHHMKLGKTDTIQISLSNHEWDDKESALKQGVGTRPVLEVNLSVNNQPVRWQNDLSPVEVTIPYTPAANEKSNLDQLVIWYINEQGVAVPVSSGRYDPARAGMTFRTMHFSTFAVAYSTKTFGDLIAYPWARQAIEILAGKGIVNGISDTSFNPDKSVTRADFLVLLTKALDLVAKDVDNGNFSDVRSNAYYSDAVRIAKSLGITSGDNKNRFRPNDPITRQEMSVLAYRALLLVKKISPLDSNAVTAKYKDISRISGYAQESVAALSAEGLIQGYQNKFNPASHTSRAEAAVFIYKIYSR